MKKKHAFLADEHLLENMQKEIIGDIIGAKRLYMIMHLQFIKNSRAKILPPQVFKKDFNDKFNLRRETSHYHPYLKKNVYYVGEYDYKQENRSAYKKGGFGIAQIFLGQSPYRPLKGDNPFDEDNVKARPKKIATIKSPAKADEFAKEIEDINKFIADKPSENYSKDIYIEFLKKYNKEYSFIIGIKNAIATLKNKKHKDDFIPVFVHWGKKTNYDNYSHYEKEILGQTRKYFRLGLKTKTGRIVKDPQDILDTEEIVELVKIDIKEELEPLLDIKSYKEGDGHEAVGELSEEDKKKFIPIKTEQKSTDDKKFEKIYGKPYQSGTGLFNNGVLTDKGFFIELRPIFVKRDVAHSEHLHKVFDGYDVYAHPLFYSQNHMPVCGFRKFIKTWGDTHRVAIWKNEKGGFLRGILSVALIVIGAALMASSSGASSILMKAGALLSGGSMFLTGIGLGYESKDFLKAAKIVGAVAAVVNIANMVQTGFRTFTKEVADKSSKSLALSNAQKTSTSLFERISNSSVGKVVSGVLKVKSAVDSVTSIVRGGETPEYDEAKKEEEEKRALMLESKNGKNKKRQKWFTTDVPLDV